MPVGAGFIPARIGENKKMTEHKKLQPEIRFAGFTDDWEQRKLGEIVDVFDGTHQTPKYTDKGIMFLSVEDIKTLKSEKYISEEDFKKEFKYFPEIGDVLMTRIGDVGTTNVICSTQPIAYYVSLALLKNKNSDPYFLSTVISSGSVQSDIWKRTLHIAFPKKINKSEIEKVIIPLPSYVEQTQIGNFFKQLDDTIALHQRELEKFKILKTSYLENIFLGKVSLFTAKNTITWEQRKLGEFSKTTIGEFVIKTKQNPNSKYPVYNGGVSYTGFYDDFNNNGHKIIVSARGANAGFINIINGKYWAGNSCYSIDIQSDNYCIEYVYHFMKHKQHLFTDFQQAANIPSVSKKNVEEFLISYPRSKEEQTQIGNFFKQLDDTIALHQKELAKYQQIKTACLEKMFVE